MVGRTKHIMQLPRPGDKVSVTGTNTGKSIMAEVVSASKRNIVVSMQPGFIRIELFPSPTNDRVYIGRAAGMEFQIEI